MRGASDNQLALLSSLSTEDLIPADHPIRRIRVVVDAVLVELDPVFESMYSMNGRPSVPPEMLLKASVLMAMYSMRSERAFCERLNYDMLFKWFLGLRIDAPSFDASTFSKNRARLLEHEVAGVFVEAVDRSKGEDTFDAGGRLVDPSNWLDAVESGAGGSEDLVDRVPLAAQGVHRGWVSYMRTATTRPDAAVRVATA